MGLTDEGRLIGLRAIYDRELAPFLVEQEGQMRWGRRLRWVVLSVGIALCVGAFLLLVPRFENTEIALMVVFVLALTTLFVFWALGSFVDAQMREKLLGAICGLLGFGYEPKAQGFERDAFAILGMAGGNSVRLQDRIFGTADGIAFDLAWGVVADKTEELKPGTTSAHRSRTVTRIDGLLLRFVDPAPPAVRFVLWPRGKPASPLALVAARTRDDPSESTGDAPLDAVFALQADDPPAARRALDAPTRAALLRIAGHFGDAKPSVGFDGGAVVFAFATPRRFDIGTMKPPLADFARVENLARQVCVVFDVAAALRNFRVSPAS